MAQKKQRVKISQLKGIKLYNFLLKELGEENKKADKKQQISAKTRRKIVSQKLYPRYKDSATIKMADIRRDLKSVVRQLPPKEICNPLFLSEAYLAFVEYYEIDNHIRTVLPDCLDVRVNAGSLGKTKIFNTRNYTYYGDGVRKIIEAIRQELAQNQSGMAYFSGVVKVKPKRKNDGTPDNYFVDYVLYINDVEQADDSPVDFDVPKKDIKKVENVRGYLSEKFKVLQKEKRKRKRAAKKLIPKKPSEQKKEVNQKIRVAINALKSLLKSGAISKEQFEKQKDSLIKLKK